MSAADFILMNVRLFWKGLMLNISLIFSDINECSSNPCDNSGVCTDGVNGYTCTCQPGTSGVHCETGMYLIKTYKHTHPQHIHI